MVDRRKYLCIEKWGKRNSFFPCICNKCKPSNMVKRLKEARNNRGKRFADGIGEAAVIAALFSQIALIPVNHLHNK